MSINSRSMLLKSLADTIVDYRQGEIAPIDASHVERWLNQFDVDDQLVILTEMDAIMKRFYFSKVRVQACLRSFIKEHVVGANDPREVLPYISFLRIQSIGSSQADMLFVIDDVLYEEYGFTLATTGTRETKTYIYVDDGIYTGGRIRYDLVDGSSTVGWFSKCPSSGCTLMIYTIATHKKGLDYIRNFVRKAAHAKQIRLQRFTFLTIDDTHSDGSSIEVLWPEEFSDSYVDSYVDKLRTSYGSRRRGIFRQGGFLTREPLFSSVNARNVVERAFLKKGTQLIIFNQNQAPSIRPLGFMKLDTLGFGTFFVTYRNIANNCPLVLWWGVGGWYPLLPRTINQQRDILVREQIFDYTPF